MESIIELDQQIFFFLNGLHADWLDQIMYWVSDKKIWIPFYVALAAWIIKTHKWQSIYWLVGIGLAITITDQTCSGFMKPFFERWRPSRDPAFEGMVHLVNGYTGGKYGFSSSHSGNAFALATFIWLLFRRHNPWVKWIFVWAAIVAYSRVYLGVHYPGDIIVGGLVGVWAAQLSYFVIARLKKRLSSE